MSRPVLVLALCLFPLSAAEAQAPPPGPPVIVTSGEAVIKRAPDQAWVSIAAESRAATPAEAQRMAAEAMTSVQAAVRKAGLPESAIRTTGYSLQPDIQYQDGRSRVRGYIARNQIDVQVDDLAKLGPVIDAAGSGGATSMAGLRFDVKDRAGVEREALRMAVEDAMGRARALAAGANASVGDILRIDEQRDLSRPIPMTAMRAVQAGAESTPITPGEIDIEARVTLTVRIR
jgi:uncharacterized protein YggE